MDDSRYLECRSADYGDLRDAATSVELTAPVPSCPGWTMVDLGHQVRSREPFSGRVRRTRMSPRIPSFLMSAAACAAIALSGCGTQHAGPAAGATGAHSVATPMAGSPRQRAVADAAHIIASFPRPPGAVRTGLIASLTAPGEGPQATPDVETATQWWRAPGRPPAVLAWVRAHLPAGFTLGSYGAGAYQPRPSVILPQSWTDQFALPAVPDVLTQRWLVVLVVADGSGQTAIRVDAQVVWLPARPAAERIPADAKVVTVTPVFGLQPDKKLEPLDRAFTVTSPAKVARIAAVIDGLTLFPPGMANCPADRGGQMRLTFRTSPDGPVVARLTAEYGGCGLVSVSIGGRSMPALSDYADSGQQLQQRVLALAGVRWPYPPGAPPGSGG